MKRNKEAHSPLDAAVFAILNSTLFATIFSLSMFNKNFEPSQFPFKKKLEFMGRNILVINTLHGMNQYLLRWFKNIPISRKNELKNKLKISEHTFYSLISLFSAFLPAYLASKVYYYKNDYLLIERKYFFGIACLFFISDYINSKNPERH